MPKVIILTGASKGLGLAALQIALAPPLSACVVAVSRSLPAELVQLQADHADRLELVSGDVSDREVSQKAVSKALARWGRLDSLVLNAGTLDPFGRLSEVDVDAFKALMDVNLFSLIHTIQVALPELRKSRGTIVLVSSGAAEKGVAGWGAYSTSKAAMNSICRTLGSEEPEVTTVAIRPGTVDTGMQAAIRSEGAAHMSAKDHATFTALHTDGVLLAPRDPGHVLAALAVNGALRQLSGSFINWNAEELADFQRTE